MRIPTIITSLLTFSFLLILSTPQSVTAEDRVIVVSSAGDLSEGLDLNALGEVFKDSSDLQHFEKQINNPQLYLNNLDLNEDGQVDFLRVLEEETEDGRMIIIQAIVGDNAFTDVAYIDIQRENDGQYKVQIRGEEALYGPRTYYVPQYEYVTWPIVTSLWAPDYYYYSSPYYWDYYPTWYSSYSCVRLGFYRARVAYRYPRNHFYFSFNARFDNYRHDHHKSHHYYRDYNWHRKDRRHNDYDRRHKDYDRRDHNNRDYRKEDRRSRSSGIVNREPSPTRRYGGEDRNVSDEKIKRMEDLRRPIDENRSTTRPRVRQERLDRRSHEPDNNRSVVIHKREKPRESAFKQPKPTPPSTNSKRTYSAPKPSKPSNYSAPAPSKPSRSYEAPRSERKQSRSYASKPSKRSYDSPRKSHNNSRESHKRTGPSRPKR